MQAWTKSKQQFFYGYPHTAPTLKEWVLQKLGLAIEDAVRMHLPDVETRKMAKPQDECDDDFHPAETTLGKDLHDEFDFDNVNRKYVVRLQPPHSYGSHHPLNSSDEESPAWALPNQFFH